MDDFEPVTNAPERIDQDTTPVRSTARSRDKKVQQNRLRLATALAVLFALLLLFLRYDPLRVIIGLTGSLCILKIGTAILGALARPMPDAPPPGELRKVKLTYRCSVCGTQLRVTLANNQVPEPPKHCTEPMELTTNLDDL